MCLDSIKMFVWKDKPLITDFKVRLLLGWVSEQVYWVLLGKQRIQSLRALD